MHGGLVTGRFGATMPLIVIALGVLVLFSGAYLGYGRILARLFQLDGRRTTPACRVNDGVDFIPTKPFFLLGQHFSAITAAGPIVGPILACLWFGWGPAILWIVLGAIFIGALHDFSSLVASVRHEGRSVAEIVKLHMGPQAYVGFLLFMWLSLVYVITAFTDLTSTAFLDPELGGGVASASTMYLFLGVVMGVVLRSLRWPLWVTTLVFLPLVGCAIWFGRDVPLTLPTLGAVSPKVLWNWLLLGYCFLASIVPVWLLLQPRGYLGGWFLYCVLAAGCFGLFLGGERAQYPMYIGWVSPEGLTLFPFLFVTIACGACSGFHGIVSSGTTSKQIQHEPDCRPVGYGAMLLEGFVAIIALATVMILKRTDVTAELSPGRIYADGLAQFVSRLGISLTFARTFALLAFTTFIYDTLDVATRLGRHILQELTGWTGWWGRLGATVATLALPVWFVGQTVTDSSGQVIPAWKAFWVLFGSSNQLLAALTLLGLTVWRYRSRQPWLLLGIPMCLMLVMTVWALLLTVWPWLQQALTGHLSLNLEHCVGSLLILLALSLVMRAVYVTYPRKARRELT